VAKQPVGSALLRFERGQMTLRLFRRADGYRWFHGRRPFGQAFATVNAAVRFVKDLSEWHNLSLDRGSSKHGRDGARKGKPA
jgi:hypothetical protein